MKLFRNAEAFAHLIDSGTIFEDLLAGIHNGRRGRPVNRAALRLALIGLGCSVITLRQATQQGAWRALNALEVDEQVAIGFRVPTESSPWPGEIVVTQPQLNRAFAAFGEGLDYGDRGRHDLHANERQRREQVVFTFVQSCLNTFDFGWDTQMYAMDATAIDSWSRRRSTAKVDDVIPVDRTRPTPSGRKHRAKRTRYYDQDAEWGVKTGKDGRQVAHFGHFEHTLVQVPHPDAPPLDVPILVRAMFVTPANPSRTKAISLGLLDAMGGQVLDLAVDRYYSYLEVTEWADVLRSMGIRQHFDLRSDEQGFRESARARWVGGCAHCPGVPTSLGTIEPPPMLNKDATDAERTAHDKLIAEFDAKIVLRSAYAMKVNRSLSDDHTVQLMCPALAGRVACPLRPETMADLSGGDVVIVENPPDPNDPEGLPKYCTQKTVVVFVEPEIRKHWQPHMWGSRMWRRFYRRRSHVEGCYGFRKNPDGGGLGRGFFKVEGMARINLTIAFSALAYNMSMLRSWAEQRPDQKVASADHPYLATKDADALVIRVPAERMSAVLAALDT